MNKLWTILTIGIMFVVVVHSINTKSSSLSPEAAVVEAPATVRLFTVTAYCPCKLCCGRWADGITASGVPAVGKIVAAPPNIAFGTVLDIPGYGRCVVEDRGGAIKENRLDVLFSTHQAALKWGVQELLCTVY